MSHVHRRHFQAQHSGSALFSLSSKKPKRRRSVGESAPKRYAVGELETSQTI
jgi:hypothetical protein